MTGTMERKPAMSADKFRELLSHLGISQSEAARRMGYTFRQVTRLYHGHSVITAATAALIRERLGKK